MSYTPRRIYTDEDKSIFIELAEEIGVSKAMRELQYPTWPTAIKWTKNNENIPKNITAALASLNNVAYTTEDRLSLLNQLIDDAQERLVNDALSPKDWKIVVDGIRVLYETYNLVQGKAMNITEKSDKFDADIAGLYADMEKKNKSIESGTIVNSDKLR